MDYSNSCFNYNFNSVNMTKSEKSKIHQERKIKYRTESKKWLNKRLEITYEREKDGKEIIHYFNGIVVKLLKNSLKLQIDDLIVNIGFRNIKNYKIL